MEKTPIQWMIEPLRKYARFSGRARRAEYWWFALFTTGLGVVAGIIDIILGFDVEKNGPVGAAVSLGMLVPSLAVSARRMHDLGRSALWLVLPVLGLFAAALIFGFALSSGGVGSSGGPMFGVAFVIAIFGYLLLLLVWFCRRGTDGPNRFGPDPLAPEHDELVRDFA